MSDENKNTAQDAEPTKPVDSFLLEEFLRKHMLQNGVPPSLRYHKRKNAPEIKW
ncbi:hypothetical protein [Escherichia coli]|uniref:hypothetical protein n=1 Tax=Escherichia coli TaxID=562 RepID=UPI0015C45FF9|nr:hypothetical protein [Escherichia coli]